MGGVFESGSESINFLDEIRFCWNRAFTSDEIESIMNTELYGDDKD